MSFRSWALATVAIAAAGGIAVYIVQKYVGPYTPTKIVVVPVENSCGIQCPAGTPYAASTKSVTCTVGVAPLCQCTDSQKPQASCVPIN